MAQGQSRISGIEGFLSYSFLISFLPKILRLLSIHHVAGLSEILGSSAWIAISRPPSPDMAIRREQTRLKFWTHPTTWL